MTIANYDAALRRDIPGAVRTTHGHYRGISIDVPCKLCGVIQNAYRSDSKLPPPAIAKALRNRGWVINNSAKKHECPIHAATPDTEPECENANGQRSIKMILAKPARLAEAATKVMAAAPSRPSEDARAARREALQWLDEAFDPEAGAYRANISDQSIAHETGLSLPMVLELREEFYGPIKEPAEFVAIRGEVARLKSRMEVAEREALRLAEEITSLVRKVDTTAIKNGWKV